MWGLFDNEADHLVCLFEAESLLTGYRKILLDRWWDELTAPVPLDTLPGDDWSEYGRDRETLLDLGQERWYNQQVNAVFPRYSTMKYELWNSVPPNIERLVMHLIHDT